MKILISPVEAATDGPDPPVLVDDFAHQAGRDRHGSASIFFAGGSHRR
jgi:hypothetical protein